MVAQFRNPADAMLGAAAPDLLSALDGLMPNNLGILPIHLDDSEIIPLDVSVGELRRAYAAIAKARGSAA